ncbi:MAG: HAMP domain-containing histidine kinase [bacterium]|nr:HAMP domain-containing histidine kinase [bacterium]
MIEAAGYRMLRMINRSLDLVKMERGMYQFQPVPVNLVQVLWKIAAETQFLLQKKRVKLEVVLNGQSVCDEDAFVVLGEDLLCYSMSMPANLIKNAIEASPEGDVVTVSLAEEDAATIRIHNTGRVAEAICDRFFEKYVTSGHDFIQESKGLRRLPATL